VESAGKFSVKEEDSLMEGGAMRKLRPYAAAIGIVAIASAAREAIVPFLGNSFPLITYWPAAVVTAYFFGFRAALFAIGVSLVAGRLLFMRPLHPLLFPAPVDVVFASFFAIFSVSVAMFMESLRIARREAESNARLAKERLRALEASEKRLHDSLKAAGSAAWEWNTETGEIICSKEFRDLTGVLAHGDHIDFASWMQSAHQDDRRQLQVELVSSAQHGTECRLEHRAWRDGEVRWLTLLGRASGPGRMTGIVVDVTDRHRMEEKLRNAAKQESLGVLSGGIAHDFNNLLTTILGYASILRADLMPDSPAADYARNIEIASERAAHLTRQILAYSGQGRIAVERIDLTAHVRQCVSDLDSVHANKIGNRIRLRMNLEQGLPTIQADPRQVDQVVTSILTNSIEAIGDESGCIQVKAKSRTVSGSDPTADVPAGQYVVLEVSDNGPGMDEITKAKIFDPFFTTKFMGRGLGLAAVQGIVRGHGGAIHLESKLGEGAAFQIFWPVADG
jgi:signal transduction histidine kinase